MKRLFLLAFGLAAIGSLATAQTQLVSDNFSGGTNGSPLGANWTGCGFSGGNYSKLAYENGNSAGGGGFNSQDCAAYTGFGAFPNDQYAQATVTAATPSSTTQAAVTLRQNVTASTQEAYIGCGWNASDFTADFHYRIWSLSGLHTYNNLYLSSVAPATGDVVACQVIGARITMSVNGSLIATVEDNSGVASGYPGLYYIDPNSGSPTTTDIIWGSFSAGTPAAQSSLLHVSTDAALTSGASKTITYTAPGTSPQLGDVVAGGSTNIWFLETDPSGITTGSGTIGMSYSGAGALTTTISLSGLPGGGVDASPFTLLGCDQWLTSGCASPFAKEGLTFPIQLSSMSSLIVDYSYALAGTITGTRDIDQIWDEWVCPASTGGGITNADSPNPCLEVEVLPYLNFSDGEVGTLVRTFTATVILNGSPTTMSFDERNASDPASAQQDMLFYPHTTPGPTSASIRFDMLAFLNQAVSDFNNPALNTQLASFTNNTNFQWLMGMEVGTEFGANSAQSYSLTLSKLAFEQTIGAVSSSSAGLFGNVTFGGNSAIR